MTCANEFKQIEKIHIEHAEGYDDGIVVIDVWDTAELMRYIDAERYALGFTPFYESICGSPVNEDGYYDFHMLVNKNGILDFYCIANESEDDFADYHIKLNEVDARHLYVLMDAECVRHYHGTIAELIDDEEF